MIAHLAGRENALEPFGWTGPQAEWIALACLHSGVFARAQLCFHLQMNRWWALRFPRALIGQEWVAEETVEGRNVCRNLQPVEDTETTLGICGSAASRMTLADARVILARLPAEMKIVAQRRSVWQGSILQFPSRCVPFAGAWRVRFQVPRPDCDSPTGRPPLTGERVWGCAICRWP